MIVVKIIGGLGNQLFQYAFGRAIEIKTGIKIYYDIEDFKNYKLRNIELQHFNVNITKAEQKEIDRLTSIYNKGLYKIFRKSNGLLVKQKQLKYYSESLPLFDETDFTTNTDVYLDGHWQSEKYFFDVSDIIRSDLEITPPPSKVNLNYMDLINHSNSVSLHIRRGDYISNPSARKIYSVCSLQYYESAINYISQRIDNPIFFVFSDDIKWVKDNLQSKHKLVLIEKGEEEASYEDLRLMSKCNHNIIANSTFSWWGAWLNSNANKIVISPQKWFNDNSRSLDSLLPKNWIKI